MQADFIELNQNDIPSVAEQSDASARERTATRMGGRKTDKSEAKKETPSVAGQDLTSSQIASPRTDARSDDLAEKKKSGTKNNLSKSNIIVRLPVEDDREAVRALARKLHDMTIFSNIEFSDAKFDKLFDRAMTRPKHMSGLVAELVPSAPLRYDSEGQALQKSNPSGQARGQAVQANGMNSARPRMDATLKVDKVKKLPTVAGQNLAANQIASPRTDGLPDGSSEKYKSKKQIIGGAWVTAGEYIIGEGEILTTVHAIGVDVDYCGMLLSGKTFLRLIQAIKKWGEARGAKRTLVHVTTGSNLKATDRLMRASGAICIGGGYVV